MTRGNIEIHPLSISDAERAAKIYNLSLLYLSGKKPISKKKMENMISKNQDLFIGAFIDNLLIGHLIFKKDSRAENSLGVGIVIDPRYQREGIGGSLLKSGIKTSRLRGFKKIKAEVFKKNHMSKNFFEKNKFKKIEKATRKIIKNGKEISTINYEYDL